MITDRQRDALDTLAAAGQPMSAGQFARRLWKDRRTNSGHWQRAGVWLRELAAAGLVVVIPGGEYTDTFRLSAAGEKAIGRPGCRADRGCGE